MPRAKREVSLRGDAAVTIRLLLRGAGMAGLAAALGGVLGIVALVFPWHEVVLTVEMMDATSSRVEATATGLRTTVWAVVSGLGGLAAAWLGLGVAFDRPVRQARAGLAAAAVLLALGALGGLVILPDAADVLGPGEAVSDPAERLPVGVEVRATVQPSSGPWITLAAAGLVAVGALGARES